MAWFPSDDETFVFKNKIRGDRVVLLIPGGVLMASEIRVNGDTYSLDEEMTEQTRMHVRVSNRKRLLSD